ncbi:MAG: histidine kinase, partial [Ilumatobacteraceae bacterium]
MADSVADGLTSGSDAGGSEAVPDESLLQQVTTVLAGLPLAVLELDGDGRRVVRANSALCAMVGLDGPALLAQTAPFPWLAEGQTDVLEQMVVAAGDAPVTRRRLVLRDRHGTDVPTVATAVALADADGRAQTLVVLEGLGGIERILMSDLERARFVLQLANERDRIARDLHDRVIQRLFAVGMGLEAAADLLAGGADIRDRLWKAVEDIDASMSEIRTTIFTLHRPAHVGARPLETLLATVEAAGRLLGHDPELAVVGPLSNVPAGILDELNAVVRELLTNVVKHAESQSCWISVVVDDGRV